MSQEETSPDRAHQEEEQVSSPQLNEPEPMAESEQTIDESNEVTKEESKQEQASPV